MKRRCVIHFGMNKTGSSSIQESLFRYAENLPDWHYLHVGSANLSGAIATAFGDSPNQHRRNCEHGLTEAQVNTKTQEIKAKLTAQLQKASKSEFLLSAEYISLMGHDALLRLIDWLINQVDEIQAVGYIRTPSSFMASTFQQRVKGGLNQLKMSNLLPRYRDRFEIFDQVLGRDQVQLWKFDPAAFPDGCVVRDFCVRLGITLPESQIIRINEGLSRESVALLYAYRKYGPNYYAASVGNNYLISVLAQLSGSKLQFSAKAVQPVLKMRREQIAWMEDRLGASLQESSADDSQAINEEADLLKFSPKSVCWLKDQLGLDAIDPSSSSPKMIAQWIDLLRLKLIQKNRLAHQENKSFLPLHQPGVAPKKSAMKTLYLHIGTEKTGTTTLQAFLNKNRTALARKGIAYLKSPGLFNHRDLATYCLDNTHIDDAIRKKNLIDPEKRRAWCCNFIESFHAEMMEIINWASSVIISSEHFHSRLTSLREIQTLHKVLSPFFDNIKIIVYLRRQDELAVSLYSTILKNGGNPSKIFPMHGHASSYYDYQLLLERWSNVFGKNTIFPKIYDRRRLIEGNIINDFAVQVELDIFDLALPIDFNLALSFEVLEILRIFNSQVPKDAPYQGMAELRKRLIARIQNMRGLPYRPARSEAIKFYQLFEKSNDALARDWFNSQQVFSDDFSQYPETVPSARVDINSIAHLLKSVIDHSIREKRQHTGLQSISCEEELPEIKQIIGLINERWFPVDIQKKIINYPEFNYIDKKPFILYSKMENNLNSSEDLFKASGGNTGNLAYTYAINNQFGGQLKFIAWHALSSIDLLTNSLDGIALLPCANQLGSHTDLGSIADELRQIDHPIVAIGLGAQSNNTEIIPEVKDGTVRWVREIIDHAPSNYPNISVRGNFTKKVLEKYGLADHAIVLGCPSLFINNNLDLGQRISNNIRPINKIAVAAGDYGWPKLAILENSLTKLVTNTLGAYITQSPLEMIKMSRGEISCLSEDTILKIKNYSCRQMKKEEFINWNKIYTHSFFNIPQWINYLSQFDFVIGTRIHGIILALQAEVPAICIVHDSRTLELCETMKIPYVLAEKVLTGISKNDIYHLFEFDPDNFDRNRINLAKNYIDFLRKNFLNPDDSLTKFQSNPLQQEFNPIVNQQKENDARLAEAFSTPDHAVRFDDAPAVAAKPIQMADPHSLIAGLLLMVQRLDGEVRDLRTQVGDLRKFVYPSVFPTSLLDIDQLQAAHSEVLHNHADCMVSIHTNPVKNKNIFDIYYHDHSSVGLFFNSLYRWQKIANDDFNLPKPSLLPANEIISRNSKYLVVIPVISNSKTRWSIESNPLLSLPRYVVSSINEKRACLLIDFSNEGGKFELLELISQSLSIIGVKNFHNVIFVCQNRIINDSSNNNEVKIFHYDSCIIKSCLTIIEQITPDMAYSLSSAYQSAKKDKIILCMNATPRPHRLYACGLLKYLHLFDNSLVSFPDLRDSKGKGQPLLLDREINFLSNTKLAYLIDSVKEITPLFPIKIDSFKEKGDALVDKICYENYISTWCSFVTETGIDNSVIRVTEKSFKAVALGHPAIIYNHPNSINLLSKFGYSLFEDIVPCNYDKIKDRIDRLIAIGEVLQSFSNRILEKSPSLLGYLSENSSYNINWTLNGFLPKYRKEYVDPIFDFINKNISSM